MQLFLKITFVYIRGSESVGHDGIEDRVGGEWAIFDKEEREIVPIAHDADGGSSVLVDHAFFLLIIDCYIT